MKRVIRAAGRWAAARYWLWVLIRKERRGIDREFALKFGDRDQV